MTVCTEQPKGYEFLERGEFSSWLHCVSSAVDSALLCDLTLCFPRFFYQSIWRTWDEEEEDEFDYFVRCVEPRLRL